jgi:hypothetical protein
MDVDTEELRLVYEAFSVRELNDELSSRGLRADGVSLQTDLNPSFRPSFLSCMCFSSYITA